MATLELVPLRSKLPTGRMTLRHSVPVFNPVVDLPLDEDIVTTTPQVAENADGETAARKGGEAR
ncbi:MAG: hypothetical protein ACKVZ6_10310 [Kineosporiaceae bacterium]|jgi:hypothetical protein